MIIAVPVLEIVVTLTSLLISILPSLSILSAYTEPSTVISPSFSFFTVSFTAISPSAFMFPLLVILSAAVFPLISISALFSKSLTVIKEPSKDSFELLVTLASSTTPVMFKSLLLIISLSVLTLLRFNIPLLSVASSLLLVILMFEIVTF